jgi:hypothetical protein
MGVRLAEGDSRRRMEEPRFALVEVSLLEDLGVLPEGRASPHVPPRMRRRRLTGRARRIRFTTWTVLAVALVSVVGSIARPARTAPSKGRQPLVTPVATPRAMAPAGSMPTLVGRQLSAARAALASLHLDPAVTIKNRWSRKPPGRVLFQRPAAGAVLHTGDRVTIIVARRIPPGIA